ncbi:MAG: tetraacyldisaccharide 4'-kinase [Herminiimonas sp.]|nr:tetraacyldisaccharide 4'-kinase [Herminiimonas sp.]
MRLWMRRGVVPCLLWPVSLLFAALVMLRRAFYRIAIFKTVQLPVPVIVVGNLFVGGTGKTPLTIWLVEMLRNAGFHPGVISRGYGSAEQGARRVMAGSSPRQVGDEPVLIAQRTGCPVMVGRDRVAAGLALLSAHPEVDVILSDDGLQHYRLGRDIEIVLKDSRGDGNGWLLPAGPLREPRSRRRDFSIVNVGTAAPAATALQLQLHRPSRMRGDAILMWLEAPLAEQLIDRTQRTTLAAIAAAVPAPGIVAAAGIGNPARFFATLSAAGLVFEPLPLPDHHDFNDTTFAGCDADLILITEKDAVKCSEIAALASDPRLWVVPVSARIAAPFADNILERLRGHATA